MATFSFDRHLAAPPGTVFDVLTDHRGISKITPVRRATLEREGDPAPNGLGAIRVLSLVGPPLREEVVAYEPDKRFSYTLLSGLPVRDYLGSVELTPDGQGTRMAYTVKLTPTVPFGGTVLVAIVKQSVGQLVSGIAKESERRAAADA
jgi:uncharacterized protein YndB with AHSA1/START domain